MESGSTALSGGAERKSPDLGRRGRRWRQCLHQRHPKNPSEIDIVGVVEADPNKQHSLLYNIPVLGTEEDIPRLVEELAVDQVTIAIPSLKPADLERIFDRCNQAGGKVNQMPRIEDVLKGKLTVSRLRNIDVVDLLGCEEVKLDRTKIAAELAGKVVRVYRLRNLPPGIEIRTEGAPLLLVGHGENSIYLIDKELKNMYGRSIEIIPIIADVQDRDRIFKVMERYKPDYVFHAAAHKHVPLYGRQPDRSGQEQCLRFEEYGGSGEGGWREELRHGFDEAHRGDDRHFHERAVQNEIRGGPLRERIGKPRQRHPRLQGADREWRTRHGDGHAHDPATS